MKVLHITPHLGGGVGTVIRNYLEYVGKNSLGDHSLISFEKVNAESKELLTKINCDFEEESFLKIDQVIDAIDYADIVLVHWWNHPLLQYFLMNVALPKSRLIFWSHISGNTAPNNFCPFVLGYPDRFIFTTPLSYFSNEVTFLGASNRKRLSCIWSTAGVERLNSFVVDRKVEQLKEISYVGNLDYTKVHKDFLELCSKLTTSGNLVNVVGPTTADFLKDLQKLPTSQRPVVHGYVDEVRKFQILGNSRIFGYPLARHNYATCDQALQEAMFFGVVPIVLNNPMESYMVKHRVTGLVARSSEEYLKFVGELIENDNEYRRLRDNSKKYARENYSIKQMANFWNLEFSGMLKRKKKKRECLQEVRGYELKAYDVFIESLGSNSALFKYHCSATTDEERTVAETQIRCLSALPQWSSNSKSTASHFASHFTEDPFLKRWAELTRFLLSD